MNDQFESLVALHMIGLLTPQQNGVQLQVNEHCATTRVVVSDTPPAIPDLTEYEGTIPFLLNSDVFELTDYPVQFKSSEPHELRRVVLKFVEAALPFFTHVMNQEQMGILYQSNYFPKQHHIHILTGLIEDVQVLFLSIKKEIKPRRGRGHIKQ